MPPVIQSDTTQTTLPLFYDCRPSDARQLSQDALFFRKENYKATVRDVRYDGQTLPYSLAHQNWLTALMLVEFFVYCFLLVRYGKVWFERVKNVWRVKQYSGLYINLSEKQVQESFPCLLMTTINLGLFAYLSFLRGRVYYESQDLVVVAYMALTTLFIGVKFLVTMFVGSVFFSRDTVMLLRSEIFSLFSYIGLIMYTLLLFMLYSPGTVYPMFWTGLAVLAIYTVLKLYKIFQVFYSGISTFFYLFLYLCTLEILPVLLLYIGMLIIRGI